ncbi:hypothetical protein CDFC105_93933 [Clostridioides difficile]|nr:hypothetical protein CDFC105_93933 [Clostridioides difficile]
MRCRTAPLDFSIFFFLLMIRRPPRSTLSSSSAASDVYKRQLPESIKSFTEKHKGLVLVTGPTGSGKSTTLASMINICLLYTSPSPRDRQKSRMPSSA